MLEIARAELQKFGDLLGVDANFCQAFGQYNNFSFVKLYFLNLVVSFMTFLLLPGRVGKT